MTLTEQFRVLAGQEYQAEMAGDVERANLLLDEAQHLTDLMGVPITNIRLFLRSYLPYAQNQAQHAINDTGGN